MDPFIAEIRAFAFNFVPRGWMPCDGRLLPIAQYTALFSLLGTTYGGNGQTNFALPNLGGTAMVSQGNGPGLSPYVLGEQTGVASVTLIITEIPSHTHAADAKIDTSGNANMINTPVAGTQLTRFAVSASGPGGAAFATAPNSSPVLMHPMMVQPAGGSQPHNNLQPYLALLYGIATEGIFPARN